MRFVRPSSSVSVAEELRLAEAASPTFSDVGLTLAENAPPPGYHHDYYEIRLGSGREIFERAVQGLKTWRAHDLRGVSVHPSDAVVRQGTTVMVCMGAVLAIAAPCRIVKVLDEQRLWGFAYATLPGHPEEGEESFTIIEELDGSVAFTIRAFSRPSDPLMKLSGPVGRAIQKRTTRGYQRALRHFVVGPGAA